MASIQFDNSNVLYCFEKFQIIVNGTERRLDELQAGRNVQSQTGLFGLTMLFSTYDVKPGKCPIVTVWQIVFHWNIQMFDKHSILLLEYPKTIFL